MESSTQYSQPYQLATLLHEHPMFTLKNVKDHLGSSWTSNKLGSNLKNLVESHGWEIEFNRVLDVWHVISEGNMPMEHTLSHRVRELLKNEPNGMSVPLMCEKLKCTEQQLVYTRNFFNRKEGGDYRLRKTRKPNNKYFLEKKDDCI